MFDGIAFAGGGNRCYWQGGFFEAGLRPLHIAPQLVVGASAGAFQACLALLGLGDKVRGLVDAACRLGRRNTEWRLLLERQSPFPVGAMYRDLLAEIFRDAELARLKSGPELKIAVSHPPRFLPLSLAIPLGIGAYQLEKKWRAPVHPASGRRLGFRPEYIAVRDLETPAELAAALLASSSVPPFMPIGRIGGIPALDGGLVDNVPVEPLQMLEARGQATLVLLTRRYARLPEIPHRFYVQPSRAIDVRQFSIDEPDGIREAYELGLADGAKFATVMRSGTARVAAPALQ